MKHTIKLCTIRWKSGLSEKVQPQPARCSPTFNNGRFDLVFSRFFGEGDGDVEDYRDDKKYGHVAS
jgi:hypothetical protein